MKKRATAATAPEPTKENNFIRIASRRIRAALKSIEVLKPLASKNSYTYTGEQVDQLVGALRKKVDEVEAAFRGGNEKQGEQDNFFSE